MSTCVLLDGYGSMPYYPLKDVKQLIRTNRIEIRGNALGKAIFHFGWGPAEIKKCILKLNDRPYKTDKIDAFVKSQKCPR